VSDIDTSVAHPARRYNYWLGGTYNFPADRASGDAVIAIFPHVRTAAIENRRFLRRAVAYLAEEGVQQFLDIGAGLPAPDGVRETAPGARILAVDNDPLVGLHAEGEFLEADLTQPERILARAREVLDFDRPIGLLLAAVLHFVDDAQEPQKHVETLVEALPPGSYLVASHATNDFMPPETIDAVMAESRASAPFRFRTAEEFGGFFNGLELVPPGLVASSEWRAEGEPPPRPSAAETAGYSGVGRVP
jgi:hypothetical protein